MLDAAQARASIRSDLEARLRDLEATPVPPSGLFTIAAEDGSMVLVEAHPGWRLGGWPAKDGAPVPYRTSRIALGEDMRNRAQAELDAKRARLTVELMPCREARERAILGLRDLIATLDQPLPEPDPIGPGDEVVLDGMPGAVERLGDGFALVRLPGGEAVCPPIAGLRRTAS